MSTVTETERNVLWDSFFTELLMLTRTLRAKRAARRKQTPGRLKKSRVAIPITLAIRPNTYILRSNKYERGRNQ